jgi:hypothetical protein
MTDFAQNFPDCTLMIRDNGPNAGFPNVEFWFYAANQSINYGYVQFEKRVNGNTFAFSIGVNAYAGWIQVSVDNAIQDQYVTWQLDTNLGIFNHGSADPGYPYSYTIHVYRPSVPDAPSRPYCYGVTVNSLYIDWEDGYNGGATILSYQVGYGQNSAGPTTIIPANHPTTLTNLPTGTVTYFWVRAQNYQGWSNWSAINSARTYLGAYIKSGGVWKLAIPYVRVSGVWKEAEPRIRTNGVWK